MNEANGPGTEADLERLAARLAMLASEEGEADNAGRAVGAMARRIGLSGGDLKRIFLAGAADVAGGAEHDRLAAEVSTLRRTLSQLDDDARRAAWERDVLREENGRLQNRLDRLRTNLRTWSLAGGGIAAVLLVVSLTAWVGHSRQTAAPRAAPAEAGYLRAAVVRPGGALLLREPERGSAPLVALRGSQRVQVRRLVWKDLFQWAEVEAPGGWVGYVLTTEIDLS